MMRFFVFCVALVSMAQTNTGLSASKKPRGSQTPDKKSESKSGKENSPPSLPSFPSPSGSSGAIVESDISAPEKGQ